MIVLAANKVALGQRKPRRLGEGIRKATLTLVIFRLSLVGAKSLGMGPLTVEKRLKRHKKIAQPESYTI